MKPRRLVASEWFKLFRYFRERLREHRSSRHWDRDLTRPDIDLQENCCANVNESISGQLVQQHQRWRSLARAEQPGKGPDLTSTRYLGYSICDRLVDMSSIQTTVTLSFPTTSGTPSGQHLEGSILLEKAISQFLQHVFNQLPFHSKLA